MKKRIIAAIAAILLLLFPTVSAFALSPQDSSISVNVINIEQSNSSTYEPIGIKNFGVYPLLKDGYMHIFYAVQIENTNKNLAVMYPHIETTISAKDGSVIKTEDQVLAWIAADDSY